jgi:hypothetical protein
VKPNYSVTVNPKNVGKESERYDLIRTDTLQHTKRIVVQYIDANNADEKTPKQNQHQGSRESLTLQLQFEVRWANPTTTVTEGASYPRIGRLV